MPLLFGFDGTVADWVAAKLGIPKYELPYTAFGVVNKDGRLTGGFVFTGYNRTGIEISLAGRGALKRGAIAGALDYVFCQLRCRRLQFHILEHNKSAAAQLDRLGAKFEGINRDFYGDINAACYSITLDDLPSLQSRWGIPLDIPKTLLPGHRQMRALHSVAGTIQ